ncbi:MAG: hypothetical protein AAB426_08100 [Myxococcota bacterium]
MARARIAIGSQRVEPLATRRFAFSDVGGVIAAIEATLVHRIIEQDSVNQAPNGVSHLVLAHVWQRQIDERAADHRRVVDLVVAGAHVHLELGDQVRLHEVEATALEPLPSMLAALEDELGIAGLVRLESGDFAFRLDPVRLLALSRPAQEPNT